MSEIRDGDLVRAVVKKGTHLAPSKNTDGAVRGTQLSDDNNQMDGQAEFIKADESELQYQNNYEERRSFKEEMAVIAAEGLADILKEVTFVLIEAATPHIKSWWNNTVTPSIKAFWSDINGKTKTKPQKTNVASNKRIAPSLKTVEPNIGLPVDLFSDKLETALERYTINVSNEEAQKELIEIVILSAVLAVKIKKLSKSFANESLGNTGDYIEWQELTEKLTANKIIESVNKILESNISLINDKEILTFSEILGRNLVVNGRYIPIESEKFKAVLAA